MKVNPVLRNETKIAVRSIKFTLMILAYVAVLAIAVMIYYNVINSEAFYNGLNLKSSTNFYVVMAVVQAALLFSIVPSLSSTAICSEREKQTLDILLSTKLTPLQIIIGKISSSSLRVIILIISMMPLYAVGSLMGGIKISYILQLILFFIINTIFMASIGVFISTCVKTSKVSTTLTYLLIVFIYLGVIAIAFGILAFSIYQYYNANNLTSYMPTISPIIYISPVIGFISLLLNQVGIGMEVNTIFTEFGFSVYSEYISILIQLVLSVIFIYLAKIKLNPLNKRSKIKSKKVKE